MCHDLLAYICNLVQDTSRGEGCFNLRCPGFVQVSDGILLGGTLPGVSEYDGGQFAFSFITYKVY